MANSDQNRDNSGNFANDRDRASEAGRKGGESSGKHQQSQSSGGERQMGGGGNFAQNPERASEAGRKGGQNAPDEKRSFSQDQDLASDAGRKGGQS